MFAQLRANLANADQETAAREFVDALNGPGTWNRRTPEQRQLVLDNIETGPACAQRPSFTAAEIASLATPVLLLTGARSPARYAPLLAATRSANPRVAPIVSIPDAAHAMHRDNPAAFNTAVLDFLARH
jgi:pimeloyl-ACP methyl ester carboxylesterase